MPAWVFLRPAPTEHAKRARLRETYVRAVGPGHVVETTPHAIEARRFATASAARSWATRFGELLDDDQVVRR